MLGNIAKPLLPLSSRILMESNQLGLLLSTHASYPGHAHLAKTSQQVVHYSRTILTAKAIINRCQGHTSGPRNHPWTVFRQQSCKFESKGTNSHCHTSNEFVLSTEPTTVVGSEADYFPTMLSHPFRSSKAPLSSLCNRTTHGHVDKHNPTPKQVDPIPSRYLSSLRPHYAQAPTHVIVI